MVLERQESGSERRPASAATGVLALAACEGIQEEELQPDDPPENHINGVHGRETNDKTELNQPDNLPGDDVNGIQARATNEETEPRRSGDLPGDHASGIQAEAKDEEIEPGQSGNPRAPANGIQSEATNEEIELHQSEYFIAEVWYPGSRYRFGAKVQNFWRKKRNPFY